MASSTLFTTPTIQKPTHNLTPSSHSFVSLRRIPTAARPIKPARPAIRLVTEIRAELSPPLVISLSTGLSLFLGRFVFFNFQRENVAKQGMPEQNGQSHFDAGDTRAKEYVVLLKSNDPVGFNIVDVLVSRADSFDLEPLKPVQRLAHSFSLEAKLSQLNPHTHSKERENT